MRFLVETLTIFYPQNLQININQQKCFQFSCLYHLDIQTIVKLSQTHLDCLLT